MAKKEAEMKTILLAGIIGIMATSAMAHSPLSGTTPANETVITEAPTEVILNFKGEIRLTRLSMTHAGTHSVDLDLSAFKGFVSDYAVPLEAMGDGTYVIDWRGLGADGHAMNGTFSFVVE